MYFVIIFMSFLIISPYGNQQKFVKCYCIHSFIIVTELT